MALAPRIAARVVAAVSAVCLGVALRAMAPFSAWWGDALAYAYFAVAACGGVRAVERNPAATPRAQWIAGAKGPGAFGLAVLALGVVFLGTARTEVGGLLAFAVLCLGVLVMAVGAGAVALGCAAGRAVVDDGADDVLDHLLSRSALSLGGLGAAAATLGLGVSRGVGVLTGAAVVALAFVVWRRDRARAAWVTRVREGREARWRWREAETAEPPRWLCADEAPLPYELAEAAPARTGEGPFREAPAEPSRRWRVSADVAAGLRRRTLRLLGAAAGTVALLALGARVSYTSHLHALPSGSPSPVWRELAGGTVVAATGGNSAVCFTHAGGTVSCVGNNADRFVEYRYGQRVPGEVRGLAGLRSLAFGFMHACARRGDGRVVCWGYGGDGRLGGSGEASASPRVVEGLTGDVVQVVSGSDFTCALQGDGALVCWGCVPTRARYEHRGCAVYQPERVAGVPPLVAVSAGASHVCGRTAQGEVWCWGAASTLPRGGAILLGPQPPQRVSVVDAVRAVFAGPQGSVAVDARGRAWAWGEVPGLPATREGGLFRVAALDGVSTVALGNAGGCALGAEGDVRCWGTNERGQRGLGHRRAVDGVTRVEGLRQMEGAVSSDGGYCAWRGASVACWGEMGDVSSPFGQ